MKIKFIKGKLEGQTRNVGFDMADYYVNIRKQAILIKEDPATYQIPEAENEPGKNEAENEPGKRGRKPKQK